MFETFVGAEIPLAVRFSIAVDIILFILLLVLGVVVWRVLRLRNATGKGIERSISKHFQEAHDNRNTEDALGKDIDGAISELVHKAYDNRDTDDAAANNRLHETLTKLAKLHTDGILSDEEFGAIKAKLISGIGGAQIESRQAGFASGLSSFTFVLVCLLSCIIGAVVCFAFAVVIVGIFDLENPALSMVVVFGSTALGILLPVWWLRRKRRSGLSVGKSLIESQVGRPRTADPQLAHKEPFFNWPIRTTELDQAAIKPEQPISTDIGPAIEINSSAKQEEDSHAPDPPVDSEYPFYAQDYDQKSLRGLNGGQHGLVTVISTIFSALVVIFLSAAYFLDNGGNLSMTLTCGGKDTLALVEELINEKMIDNVIKTKLIFLPRFSEYLLDPSTLPSVRLSNKHLTYRFGSKGTVNTSQDCFVELSIDGSVVVSGSLVKVSLDKKVIEYSIARHDDGSSGVLMRPLELYALELE